MDVILETRSLTKQFKGFTAVSEVNLKIQRGHIHALIGPNGAGKTTCFNLLTKFLVPSSGAILYNGRDVTGASPHSWRKTGSSARSRYLRCFPTLRSWRMSGSAFSARSVPPSTFGRAIAHCIV